MKVMFVRLASLGFGERSAQRSFAQPLAAFTVQQRDAQRRAKRGAEAPGQRTAARRLLRRVRRRPAALKLRAKVKVAPLRP